MLNKRRIAPAMIVIALMSLPVYADDGQTNYGSAIWTQITSIIDSLLSLPAPSADLPIADSEDAGPPPQTQSVAGAADYRDEPEPGDEAGGYVDPIG